MYPIDIQHHHLPVSQLSLHALAVGGRRPSGLDASDASSLSTSFDASLDALKGVQEAEHGCSDILGVVSLFCCSEKRRET